MPPSVTHKSAQKQQKVLERFHVADLNLLVSTSVAEEGLDLTQCALVMRFDPPDTALEFIQSRGRARAPESHMVLLLEAGNIKHATLLEDVRRHVLYASNTPVLHLVDRFDTRLCWPVGHNCGRQQAPST